MSSIPSASMLTNSGRLTARFAAVALSIRIAGLSLPFASRWVRYICVYGDLALDENTSQRPLGEKLCHEFIRGVFDRMRRACPPSAGTIYNWLSGRMSSPLRHWTNTIHRPSGDTLGNVLLMPLREAPVIGSGLPPSPLLNGIR